MTSLNAPAGTAMITFTRLPYANVKTFDLINDCDAQGNYVSEATGVTGLGCQTSLGNGTINYGFFDGHAKNMKATQAVANDAYGLYAAGAIPEGPTDKGGQTWIQQNMRKFKEWQ